MNKQRLWARLPITARPTHALAISGSAWAARAWPSPSGVPDGGPAFRPSSVRPFSHVVRTARSNYWILVGVLLCVAPSQTRAQFGGPALVDVSPVRAQALAAGQEYVGTIVPIRTAVVGSAVDGRVIEFPINEGDRVEAGQTLAKLLTKTIELELQASQAELRLRESELEELVNGSRPDELLQAKARLEATRAQKEYLVERRKRTEALFRQQRTVSQENLQEAVSASLRR